VIRVLLLVLAALLSLSVKLCAQTNPVPAAQKTEVPSFSPEKSTCPPKCEGPVTASGPEVRLSEILVSTKGVEEGTEAWAQLQGKAEGILVSLRAGFRFEEEAKLNSDGPTADVGGDMGYFEKGILAKSIEGEVLAMKVGEITGVIRTKQGFLILKLTDRLETGQTAGIDQGLEIVSATEGFNYVPYVEREIESIRTNWYALIPDAARLPQKKAGVVIIQFTIQRNGQVKDLRVEVSSGDIRLDRAAYAAVAASNPFDPLPEAFSGPYLSLRASFHYNPEQRPKP